MILTSHALQIKLEYSQFLSAMPFDIVDTHCTDPHAIITLYTYDYCLNIYLSEQLGIRKQKSLSFCPPFHGSLLMWIQISGLYPLPSA